MNRFLMSRELGFTKLGIDIVILLLFIKECINWYNGKTIPVGFMIFWSVIILVANLGNVGFILRLIEERQKKVKKEG